MKNIRTFHFVSPSTPVPQASNAENEGRSHGLRAVCVADLPRSDDPGGSDSSKVQKIPENRQKPMDMTAVGDGKAGENAG
jgi:hypothetical protein